MPKTKLKSRLVFSARGGSASGGDIFNSLEIFNLSFEIYLSGLELGFLKIDETFILRL